MKHWFFYKKRHYILVVILLLFFLSLPSLSIFFYSFSSAEKLQNLPIAILLEYLKQTFFLSLGVCFFSALLGITQALLVVFFDLPKRGSQKLLGIADFATSHCTIRYR